MTNDDRVARTVAYVESTLPSTWPAWPGGWPGQIEVALIDAVLSIRARYGRTPDVGVRGAIGRLRVHTGERVLDDLGQLATWDPQELALVLRNEQKLQAGRAGHRLKSAAIVEAAGRLVDVGVVHAADLSPNLAAAKRAYLGTQGLGHVTWAYFGMLLGIDDVKADTWVVRFVREALGEDVDSTVSRQVLSESAARLNVEKRVLDHAVWSLMRSRHV